MKNRALIRLFIFLICNHLIASCNFGPGCPYECHCEGGSECDAETGHCENGCDDGDPFGYFWRGAWHGPGCQIGNIAYGKSASQATGTELLHPSNAVDGNSNPDISAGHCSRVLSSIAMPWWEVQLGALYVITEANITVPNNHPDRLSRIDIRIKRENQIVTTCGTTGENAWQEIIMKCAQPSLGDAVRLVRPEFFRIQLCEVMITGYLYQECEQNWFGPACLLPCNCEASCDDISGLCSGSCLVGWAEENCQLSLPQIIVDDLSWTIDGNFLFLSIPPVAESLLLAEMSVEAKNESSTTWQTVGQIWRPPLGRFIYEVTGLDQGVVYDVRVIAYYEADDKRYEGHPSQPLRASYQEKPLSSREIGLIVGLVCSIIILFVVAFGVFCYRKRSARTEVSGVVGPGGDGEQEMNVQPSGPPTDSDEYEELALPHTTKEGGVRQDIEPGPGHMYENME